MDYTRVLDKLDHLVETKDFDAARELLDYWIADAVESRDKVGELNLYNESMGLYRKIGDMEKAMESVSKALSLAESDAMAGMIITGTTFVNAATVYKAFGQAADSIPLFEKAKALYETDLREDDVRLGGLYNNMGLALLDLKRYDEALDSYRQALGVMEKVQPRRVFIHAGSNDGVYDDMDRAGRYIDRIMALRDELSPDTEMCFFSLTPVIGKIGARRQQVYDAYNAWLEAKCADVGAVYVDIATGLKGEDGFLPDDLCYDGEFHLNSRGNAVWAQELLNYAQSRYEAGLWDPAEAH